MPFDRAIHRTAPPIKFPSYLITMICTLNSNFFHGWADQHFATKDGSDHFGCGRYRIYAYQGCTCSIYTRGHSSTTSYKLHLSTLFFLSAQAHEFIMLFHHHFELHAHYHDATWCTSCSRWQMIIVERARLHSSILLLFLQNEFEFITLVNGDNDYNSKGCLALFYLIYII